MILASGGRLPMHKADADKAYDDRQHEDKPLAATIAVLAFLFVVLGLTPASIGLLLAHGAYAVLVLFDNIAG